MSYFFFRLSSSTCDSSSLSERELDYEAEWESDSESDVHDDDRPSRPPPPPPAPPQRRYPPHGRHSRRQQRSRQSDSTEESDTSTEVGSSDLSSEDSSDEETEESETSSDEFSSASATECEFTDSEGRPNPFHKELEEGRVVGPDSPGAARRIFAQHLIPADPSQEPSLIKAPEAPAYEPKLTYSNKYQYKTPNLSDRLRTEQHASVTKAQDFSTRKALNLKKNWVSDSATDLTAKKKAPEDKSQIDNRLKSLMDRLSNQQKLLKPAEKPSTEMQHFLKASQRPDGSQPAKTSPGLAGGPTSPPVTSPPATSGSTSFNSLYPAPPVYKSSEEPVVSPPTAGGDNKEVSSSELISSKMVADVGDGAKKNKNVLSSVTEESASDRSFVESNQVASNNKEESKEASSRKSSDVIDLDEAVSKEAVVEAKSILAPVALNETLSSTRDDDFQSCEEEEEDAENIGKVNEVINPELKVTQEQQDASKEGGEEQEFFSPTPAENAEAVINDDDKPADVVKPPEEPASLPPLEDCNGDEESAVPLAASSPVDLKEIALIDEGIDDSKDEIINVDEEEEVKEEEEPEEPRQIVFNQDDVTQIYQESNPHLRKAKMNTYKQKEKSVVHDLILSGRGGRARSSSAARRPMRALPSSGPPPPPPDEPPAEKPTQAPPPIKDLVKKPDAAKTSSNKAAWSSYKPPNRGATKSSALEKSAPLATEETTSSAKSTPLKKQLQPSLSSSSTSSGNRPGRGEVRHLNLSTNAIDKNNDELASPTTSLHSHCDMDSYMDGIGSSDESKSSAVAKPGNNNNSKPAGGGKGFMKTISGIFNRSASLSSVNRNPRMSLAQEASSSKAHGASTSSHHLAASSSSSPYPQQPNTASDNNNQPPGGGSKEPKASTSSGREHNFRFPKLNFSSRSASAQHDVGGIENNSDKHNGNSSGAGAAASPDSPPSGIAPKADISELGSLTSLSSSATPKKAAPTAVSTSKTPFNLSVPSTPPVPLSRKITIGLEQSASTGSVSSTVSENEENESPEDNSACSSDLRRREEQLRKDPDRQVPLEILEKIMRRGGSKAAKRQARVAQVKRVRKAQEIQRQLEEVDVMHKDMEERGIKAEKSIRGESGTKEKGRGEEELMQTWFRLLSEKNKLVRREQELLVQAKHLELEDASAKLEAELREHLMLDSRSPEVVAREGEVLSELLRISEQREKLQAMLERDKLRYQREDKDMEAQLAVRGIRLAPIAAADE